MKRLRPFYCVLLLSCFAVTIIGCHKRIEDMEQNINSKKMELRDSNNVKEINVQQNGIAVEYCLLNENGQPAISFKEGEQFIFHLAITNNNDQDTSMYVVTNFLRNPNLFMVFKSEFDTVGKPVNWNGMYKRGDNFNEIKKGGKWFLELPWHETRGSEIPYDFNNLIRVFQHFFKGNSQPYLAKGKYFSEFKQQFCLGRHLQDSLSQRICTDTIQFKINFEIK